MCALEQIIDAPTEIRHKSGRRVLSSISDSWKRCRALGLATSGKPLEVVVSQEKFKAIVERNHTVRQFVLPELELLFSQIAGTNFMVAYADNSGVVLDSIQDSDFKAGEGGKAVIPGSVWLENQRGTNALGLALHTRRPAVVSGPDHFFRKLNELSCFAVPIFDPEENVIGVIDATSDAKSRNDHTLALVKLAARNIENRLLIDRYPDNLILMFHARHEYLPTTSVRLMALDNYGFIEGVNANAKGMLNGLSTARRQHFSEVFAAKFSDFSYELRAHDVLQIRDILGSTVFIKAYPTPSKKIVQFEAGRPKPAIPPTIPLETDKGKIDKPFDDDILKKSILQAIKSVKIGLPLIVEGGEGAGKSTLAQHIFAHSFPESPVVSLDCHHIDDANAARYLFGRDGRSRFFDPSACEAGSGKLGIARGGSVIIENAHKLSMQTQAMLVKAMLFEEDQRLSGNAPSIMGWAFVGPKDWVRRHVKQLDPNFVNAISGFSLEAPSLNYRSDFKKIASCMLQEISASHILSAGALALLERENWQGNLRQLRKVLRQAVARSDKKVIRSEIGDILSHTSMAGLTPCPACIGSPARSENCILIQKTWRDTGGNVSLVARRLGISRNTVYKHINNAKGL